MAAAALLLAAALGVPAARHLREVPPAEMRFELVTPPTSEPQSFALSPDGRRVVFVAEERGGAARLWLRPLGSTAAQPIAGTDEATLPFWSPDGRSIGFFAGGQLKRLDLASGATRALAAAQAPSGGSWNADGVILFARAASPILRVSADGGEPRPATTLGSQNTHRFPVFLPDGQHFLFYIRGGGPAAGVFLGALDGASQTRLTAADVAAAYLPSGWVLWKSGGALLAQRLDVQGRALTGPQVTVADGLVGDSGVSTSASGLIAYRSVPDVERQLVWYNRAGERLGTVGAPETGLASELRVAPDGRRVATARSVAAGQSDIWLLDGSRSQRVTSDDADDKWPVWAPDGERVAFSSTRPGVFTLYARRTDGTTPEQPLLPPGRIALPNDWSHDGRFLLYASAAADGRYDLLVHPMVDGVLPGAVVQSAFNEAWARFSPDDRWIAYQSGRPAEDWPLPVPERGRA